MAKVTNGEAYPTIKEATEMYDKYFKDTTSKGRNPLLLESWLDEEWIDPELAAKQVHQATMAAASQWKHPMLGKRVLCRTYSAGVHIGTLASVNPDNMMECYLDKALRLWKWTGGGLSLSAVAHNGIKGGRLNRTDSIVLTNVIEYIPVTEEAEKTYAQFIED